MIRALKTKGMVWGGFCLLVPILLSFANIPEKVMVKVHAAVSETYATQGYSLQAVVVPESLHSKLVVDFQGGRLQEIREKDKLLGYAYIGEAASMKNKFDYVILFDPQLGIKKSKVLIYREDYGRQIGSQRWLKQFIGLGPSDAVIYGDTVDAISGATISAKSMAAAVDGTLRALALLKEKGILNTEK